MNLYFVGKGSRFEILGRSLFEYLSGRGMVENYIPVEDIKGVLPINENDYIYSNHFIKPITARVIAPDYNISKYWDNKITQYDNLSDVVRVPKYDIYSNVFDLIKNIKNIKPRCFISNENSEGGMYCFIYKNQPLSEIYNRFRYKGMGRIRVSDFVNIKKELSCHVVIFRNGIFIGPLLRCGFKNEVEFNSISYPTDISVDLFDEIKLTLRNIANKVRLTGYLGVLGIDLMIDENSQISLVELNPRKMGSSVVDSSLMELECGISMPALEFISASGENIPDDLDDMPLNCGYKISMCMSDDLGLPINGDAGGEREEILKGNSFCLKYIDFYNNSFPQKHFTIEGTR